MKSNLGWENYTFFRKSTVKLVQKAFFVCFHGLCTRARAVGCNVSKLDLVYIFAHESLGKWSLETVLLLVGGGGGGGTFEIQEGSFPSWGKTNDKLSLHLNDQVDGDH